MPDQWYYEHELKKCGPVSPRQLRELADKGVIRPTDTIWKEGIDRGVPAARVKNLFAVPAPAAVESAPVAAAVADIAPPVAEPAPEVVPAAEQPAPAEAPPPQPQGEAAPETPAAEPAPEAKKPETTPSAPKPQVRRAKATAIRGLVITAQDGSHVQFRKKCVVCGHEHPSKMRMPIKNGMNRVNFFCTKCKKLRQAEFQGSQ